MLQTCFLLMQYQCWGSDGHGCIHDWGSVCVAWGNGVLEYALLDYALWFIVFMGWRLHGVVDGVLVYFPSACHLVVALCGFLGLLIVPRLLLWVWRLMGCFIPMHGRAGG